MYYNQRLIKALINLLLCAGGSNKLDLNAIFRDEVPETSPVVARTPSPQTDTATSPSRPSSLPMQVKLNIYIGVFIFVIVIHGA